MQRTRVEHAHLQPAKPGHDEPPCSLVLAEYFISWSGEYNAALLPAPIQDALQLDDLRPHVHLRFAGVENESPLVNAVFDGGDRAR